MSSHVLSYSGPHVMGTDPQGDDHTGDIASARDYAQRALDAFTRYDDPGSANIAESSAVVAEIGKLAKK